MAWDELTKQEQAEVRDLVERLRQAGVYESVSQVTQNLDVAAHWAAGGLPLADLCRRTGWTVTGPSTGHQAADAGTSNEATPRLVDRAGERVLLLTWAQFQAREHNVGGWLVRFKLPGGYDYSQYLTEEYEPVSGDPLRQPQPDDLVYAKIKTDSYGKTGAGRPRVGEKVETRLPDDVLRRVDEFASATSRSRAEALRVLITAGLQRS